MKNLLEKLGSMKEPIDAVIKEAIGDFIENVKRNKEEFDS